MITISIALLETIVLALEGILLGQLLAVIGVVVSDKRRKAESRA